MSVSDDEEISVGEEDMVAPQEEFRPLKITLSFFPSSSNHDDTKAAQELENDVEIDDNEYYSDSKFEDEDVDDDGVEEKSVEPPSKANNPEFSISITTNPTTSQITDVTNFTVLNYSDPDIYRPNKPDISIHHREETHNVSPTTKKYAIIAPDEVLTGPPPTKLSVILPKYQPPEDTEHDSDCSESVPSSNSHSLTTNNHVTESSSGGSLKAESLATNAAQEITPSASIHESQHAISEEEEEEEIVKVTASSMFSDRSKWIPIPEVPFTYCRRLHSRFWKEHGLYLIRRSDSSSSNSVCHDSEDEAAVAGDATDTSVDNVGNELSKRLTFPDTHVPKVAQKVQTIQQGAFGKRVVRSHLVSTRSRQSACKDGKFWKEADTIVCDETSIFRPSPLRYLTPKPVRAIVEAAKKRTPAKSRRKIDTQPSPSTNTAPSPSSAIEPEMPAEEVNPPKLVNSAKLGNSKTNPMVPVLDVYNFDDDDFGSGAESPTLPPLKLKLTSDRDRSLKESPLKEKAKEANVLEDKTIDSGDVVVTLDKDGLKSLRDHMKNSCLPSNVSSKSPEHEEKDESDESAPLDTIKAVQTSPKPSLDSVKPVDDEEGSYKKKKKKKSKRRQEEKENIEVKNKLTNKPYKERKRGKNGFSEQPTAPIVHLPPLIKLGAVDNCRPLVLNDIKPPGKALLSKIQERPVVLQSQPVEHNTTQSPHLPSSLKDRDCSEPNVPDTPPMKPEVGANARNNETEGVKESPKLVPREKPRFNGLLPKPSKTMSAMLSEARRHREQAEDGRSSRRSTSSRERRKPSMPPPAAVELIRSKSGDKVNNSNVSAVSRSVKKQPLPPQQVLSMPIPRKRKRFDLNEVDDARHSSWSNRRRHAQRLLGDILEPKRFVNAGVNHNNVSVNYEDLLGQSGGDSRVIARLMREVVTKVTRRQMPHYSHAALRSSCRRAAEVENEFRLPFPVYAARRLRLVWHDPSRKHSLKPAKSNLKPSDPLSSKSESHHTKALPPKRKVKPIVPVKVEAKHSPNIPKAPEPVLLNEPMNNDPCKEYGRFMFTERDECVSRLREALRNHRRQRLPYYGAFAPPPSSQRLFLRRNLAKVARTVPEQKNDEDCFAAFFGDDEETGKKETKNCATYVERLTKLAEELKSNVTETHYVRKTKDVQIDFTEDSNVLVQLDTLLSGLSRAYAVDISGRNSLTYLQVKTLKSLAEKVHKQRMEKNAEHMKNELFLPEDVVSCVCARLFEDGPMLQCERCHTWQHEDCFLCRRVRKKTDGGVYMCAQCSGTSLSMPVCLLKPPNDDFLVSKFVYFLSARISATRVGQFPRRIAIDSCYFFSKELKRKHSPVGCDCKCTPDYALPGIILVERLFVDPTLSSPSFSRALMCYGRLVIWPTETSFEQDALFQRNEVVLTQHAVIVPARALGARCAVLDDDRFQLGSVAFAPKVSTFLLQKEVDFKGNVIRKDNDDAVVPLATGRFAFDADLLKGCSLVERMMNRRQLKAAYLNWNMFKSPKDKPRIDHLLGWSRIRDTVDASERGPILTPNLVDVATWRLPIDESAKLFRLDGLVQRLWNRMDYLSCFHHCS